MPNFSSIRAWHGGLLSGRFQQTIGHLENDNGNCCLGVACRVAIDHGVVLDVTVKQDDPRGTISFDGKSLDMPHKVTAWLGLWRYFGNDGENPILICVHGGWVDLSAAALNDNGHTFEQIAEDIQATWPEAFQSGEKVM